MGEGLKRGSCLVEQQIREKIKQGAISGENIKEEQIQVSSFEPRLGTEVFIIDDDIQGIFRPQANERIYDLLMRLPPRQRQRIDITNGFEIKKGASYLFPLQEQILVHAGERIMSSPKSSFGRLFLHTRLLTDYNPCVDEINAQYKSETLLRMWLLIQPLTFNLIVFPGLTLNQVRLFSGFDCRLSDQELLEEWKRNPLLFVKDQRDGFIAANPIISEGLQIHLDVCGEYSRVIGLRARHNPLPIDLHKIRGYDVEEYFELIYATGQGITIRKGEHYLLSSKEILRIPPHLSVELKSHSHVALTGPLHFAGFIDNGFEGNLVFEVRSDEIANTELRDGMPISKMDVFRTDMIPQKIYSKASNNYKGQAGCHPAKFFRPLVL